MTEFYLTFKPKPNGTFTWTTELFAKNDQKKDNAWEVDEAFDWYVDYDTGRIQLYSPVFHTGTNETLSYEVSPIIDDWPLFENVSPNLIPDPRQTSWTGVKIELDSNKFYIHLPPRSPIFNIDRDSQVNYPSAANTGSNLATTGDLPYRFWQSTAVDALDDPHYRYLFPKYVRDGLSGLSEGDIVGQGTMYLWNASTGTIIKDVVFRKPSALFNHNYILEVESTEFDLDSVAIASSDSEADAEATFSASNLVLICCGASITRSIQALYRIALGHKHDNTSQESQVKHRDLLHQNPPTPTYTSHSSQYPTHLPPWLSSKWAHDDHTSLLSRGGAHSTRPRDALNNAMLGHFLLANADESGARNFLDGETPDESYRSFYGDLDGPSTYSDIDGNLTLSGTDSHKIISLGEHQADTFSVREQLVTYTYNVHNWSVNDPTSIALLYNQPFSDGALRFEDASTYTAHAYMSLTLPEEAYISRILINLGVADAGSGTFTLEFKSTDGNASTTVIASVSSVETFNDVALVLPINAVLSSSSGISYFLDATLEGSSNILQLGMVRVELFTTRYSGHLKF